MMVLLSQLLAEPGLALRLLTALPDPALSWVHSSDLADPSPFVDPGQMLLTTGTQFEVDADDAAYEAYVARLSAAGIRALGFGTEVARSGTPVELVRACEHHHLPLVEVPYRTPFIAIVRRVADALADQAHARDAWTLQAQRAIAVAALSQGRMVAVLDELARRLPASVTMFDAHGAVISRHGPGLPRLDPDPVDAEAVRLLRQRVRSGSAVEVAGRRTLLQTLGRRHELRGVLAVTPRAALDPAATAVLTSAVALAEFALEDAAQQQARDRTFHAQLWLLLLEGHYPVVGRALHSAGQRLPEAPLRVLVADLAGSDDLEAGLHARATQTGSTVFSAPYEEFLCLLVEDRWRAEAAAVADRLRTRVGVSRPVPIGGLEAAFTQARTVLRQSDSRQHGAVFADDDGGRILGLVPRDEVADLARTRLAALTADPLSADLVRTVEVWLRHNAQWEPAARELGLHRHTVKAQIRRIQALVDLPLDTFAGKAELWALLSAR